MDKKGFTLIELLGVIAILGIVISISVISIGKSRDNSIKRVLEERIEEIETAAVLYAQKHKEIFESGNSKKVECITLADKYKNLTFCAKITVADLLTAGYLESRQETSTGIDFINPVTNKTMKNDKILLYFDNNRFNSIMLEEDIESK